MPCLFWQPSLIILWPVEWILVISNNSLLSTAKSRTWFFLSILNLFLQQSSRLSLSAVIILVVTQWGQLASLSSYTVDHLRTQPGWNPLIQQLLILFLSLGYLPACLPSCLIC